MIAEPDPSLFADVLRDTVDLHIHSGPDIFPRSVTALEAARAAQAARMRAIVLKSHSADTAARAEMVREATGFPVYGGVTLNYPVGGLNPHAVLETARQGGRVVWFPSINARNFIPRAHLAPMLAAAIPKGVRGLAASHRGRLLPEAGRILDIIAENGLLLCAGHLAAADTAILFGEASRRGIERMVVNHVDADFMNISVEDARALAAQGAFIEITKVGPIDRRAGLIRAVGVESCVLATDAGPTVNPPPARLFHETITGLRDLGFTPEEIRYLSVEVPSYLLGLEGFEARPRPPQRTGAILPGRR
jgi:hypothetical protein